MKITYKNDYALKAILDLAILYNKEEAVSVNDMAARIDAPVKFLEQILLELKRGGFVESKRGKVGGYLLSKHPSKIRLGDVIRYVDGPLEPVACVNDDYAKCSDIRKCVFRSIWKEVARATSDIVDNVTFEDLAIRAGIAEEAPCYSI